MNSDEIIDEEEVVGVSTEGVYKYTITNGEATMVKCNVGQNESIEELVFPSTLGEKPVTVIGEEACAFKYAIKKIVIPDSVREIKDDAFKWDSGTTEIIIPEGVTTIGTGAFLACQKLTSIKVPGTVTTIGTSAFVDC